MIQSLEECIIEHFKVECRLVCLKGVPVFSGNFDGELAPYFLPLFHVVIPTLNQRHHRCGLFLYKQYVHTWPFSRSQVI
jgi:hypothetical protein